MVAGAQRAATEELFSAVSRERTLVLGSVAVTLTVGFGCGLVWAPDATLELLGLLAVSIVAAGKFLPLWGISGQSHFTAWELGLAIWALDTVSVLVIVYALQAFYRFGRLKRALDRVQHNSRLVLAAYPGIRRAALTGVVVFVLFPVAGTGAVGGTFLAILLGLDRRTVIGAVSLGGLLGGMLMAFAAVNFRAGLLHLRELQQAPTAKYALIAAVLLLVAGCVALLNRTYRRALAKAQAEGKTL
jgi:uncharacterized membrane protein